MEKNTNNIIQTNIPKISERDYWFVRTDSGDYFDDYYNNEYVAIGWDYLTISKVKTNSEHLLNDESLKKLIASNEKINITDNCDEDIPEEEYNKFVTELSANRRRVTTILNKVKSFVNSIKVGDVIVTPSKNSSFVAIGLVIEEVYEDSDYITNFSGNNTDIDYQLCPYAKRVKVKWHNKTSKNNLDIYLQNSLKAQQAIFSLNDYSDYIDRNINDIFVKNNLLHSIIRTNQNGNISLSELKFLIDFLHEYTEKFSSYQDCDYFSPDNIQIKLNIHSPGILEIIAEVAVGSIALIALFSAWKNHKHGGKFQIKILGHELSFESNGSELTKLENRKLDLQEQEMKNNFELDKKRLELIEKMIDVPDYYSKIDKLKSLNLDMPDITLFSDSESKS